MGTFIVGKFLNATNVLILRLNGYVLLVLTNTDFNSLPLLFPHIKVHVRASTSVRHPPDDEHRDRHGGARAGGPRGKNESWEFPFRSAPK